MPGNVYHRIDVRDGQVLAGDQYIQISSVEGPLFFLGNHTIDLQGLSSELQQTASECRALQKRLKSTPDTLPITPSVSSSEDELRNGAQIESAMQGEVDELESMLETLSFHISEGDFKSGEGWQRPLSELNETLSGYRGNLKDLRTSFDHYETHPQVRAQQFADTQKLIRDLRLKLSISIALVTYCSFQTSQATQTDHIQELDDRLRAVLDQLENEKASKLSPGLPLASTNLKDIASARSLLLRRYVDDSLADDRESIRAASMQVSSIVDSIKPSLPGQTRVTGSTSDIIEESGRKWVTISLARRNWMNLEEFHRDKILIGVDQTVQQAKIQLLTTFGARLSDEWSSIARSIVSLSKDDDLPRLRTSDLELFCGFVRLHGTWHLRDYVYEDHPLHIICYYRGLVYPSERFDQKMEPVSLRALRGLISRRHDFETDGFMLYAAEAIDISRMIAAPNVDLKTLLSQALAWTTIAMMYDSSRGKYCAMQAYESASSILGIVAQRIQQVDNAGIILIRKALDTQVQHLDTYSCSLNRELSCYTTDLGNDGLVDQVRVLAVIDEIKEAKVVRVNGAQNLLSAAWDLQNGWVSYKQIV